MTTGLPGAPGRPVDSPAGPRASPPPDERPALPPPWCHAPRARRDRARPRAAGTPTRSTRSRRAQRTGQGRAPPVTAPPLPLLHIRVVRRHLRPPRRPLHRPQRLRPGRHLRRAHRPPCPFSYATRDQQRPPAAPAPAPAPPAADTPAPAPPAPAPPAPGTRRSPPRPPARTPPHPAATAPRSPPAAPPPAPAPPRRATAHRRAAPPAPADSARRPRHAHRPAGPASYTSGTSPSAAPVATHRLLRVQRPRVELRRSAQPQRMPRRGQRDPQPGHPERPQPPQRQREPDRPRLAGQPLHPVHRVLADDRDARRRPARQVRPEGHFPMRPAVLNVVPRAWPQPKDRTEGTDDPTGGVGFPWGLRPQAHTATRHRDDCKGRQRAHERCSGAGGRIRGPRRPGSGGRGLLVGQGGRALGHPRPQRRRQDHPAQPRVQLPLPEHRAPPRSSASTLGARRRLRAAPAHRHGRHRHGRQAAPSARPSCRPCSPPRTA